MTTTDLVHLTHEFIPRLTPEVNAQKIQKRDRRDSARTSFLIRAWPSSLT